MRNIFIFSFFFVFLCISSNSIFAASSGTFFDVSVPGNYIIVSNNSSTCGGVAECANSQNSNNCGLPTCSGGNTWTKYSLTCARNPSTGRYYSYYNPNGVICSIGDKCSAGNTSLNAGFCDCTTGSTYKYCCDATGAPEACIAAGTQDNNDPPEGQCPGGYIVDGSRVRSSACTPIIMSTPTPTPTPTPSSCINNDPCSAGQVGSSVCSGSGVSKTCYNFGGTYCWWSTTCSSGTACYSGVCRAGCVEGSTQSICIQSQSCNL